MDGTGDARAEKGVADDTVFDLKQRNDVKYTPKCTKYMIAELGIRIKNSLHPTHHTDEGLQDESHPSMYWPGSSWATLVG